MRVKMKHRYAAKRKYMTRSGNLVELVSVDDTFVYGLIDGVEHSWYLKGGGSLTFKSELDLIRIIKPSNKYAKDFAKLPEGYDWLAMDSDGYWWAHKSKPRLDSVGFMTDATVIEANLPPVKDWRKSLKRRQDYIVNYPVTNTTETYPCEYIPNSLITLTDIYKTKSGLSAIVLEISEKDVTSAVKIPSGFWVIMVHLLTGEYPSETKSINGYDLVKV
jgi:hypothetical protein